jgi:16S rRNA (guanine966-N2)-methyltransferase
MDRVKAAIFSSLGDAVIGARVLDLFAGSGGLGIEALSRGASSVIFVEADPEAAGVINNNLAKTNLSGRVRQRDVFDFLQHAPSAQTFELIFADPPYDKTPAGESFTEKLLANKQLPQLLDPAGLFVLEKRPEEVLPDMNLWQITRRKTYGATEVLFLSQTGATSPRVARQNDRLI